MRFLVEFVLPPRNIVIARQLDADAWELSNAALLGEHMIRDVQRPRAVAEDGQPRTDLFAFDLDLDPEHPVPKAGDELELELG